MKYLILLFISINCEGQLIHFFSTKKIENPNADYYVSVSGNDNNPGTLNAPFKTIAKINSLASFRNKTIAFKRGDIFIGSLYLSDNYNLKGNLTKITSYGSGNLPIITGKKLITGFTNLGGNIWSKTDSNFPSEIRNVWQGTALLTLGRFPKTGYSIYTSSVALSGYGITITDSTLTAADGYWNGAEVVFKSNNYYICRERVTYASKTFTLPTNVIVGYKGFGYFIQNDIKCCISQGEWAYNNSTKTLYIYSTTELSSIYVSYYDNNIVANNLNKFAIENIHCEGSAANSIIFRNCDNFRFSNSQIIDSGINSIALSECHDFIINDNILQDQNNLGIAFEAYKTWYPATVTRYGNSYNIDIHNNTINGCGIILGKAQMSHFSTGVGINLGQTYNVNVYNNNIANTTYNAIQWSVSGNTNIYQNYIHDYCLNLTDGGGIYTWGNSAIYNNSRGLPMHGGKIYSNTILNSTTPNAMQGVLTGTFQTDVSIYNDDESDNIEVYNNTVKSVYVACKQGINTDTVNIHDNTFMELGGKSGSGLYIGNQGHHDVSKNNIIAILKDTSEVFAYGFGYSYDMEISGNKYYFPFGTAANNKIIQFGATYTYAEWLAYDGLLYRTNTSPLLPLSQSNEVLLTSSLIANSSKPKIDYVKLLTNPSKDIITINASSLPYSDYIDLTGTDFGASRTIQPYQSLIIVRKEN